MAQQEDIQGLIGDLARLGSIETVDLANAKITVRLGDVLSQPCGWFELAGAFRSWTPPVVGEQVLLLCAEGDINHGVALRGIYCTAFPAPGNDTTGILQMPDGTKITYDPDGHVLAIAAVGKVTIAAPEGVEITADVTVTGDMHVTGTATVDTDVIGGGKSLKHHKHGGVQAGAAQTGEPA